jgi:hypothetical protein
MLTDLLGTGVRVRAAEGPLQPGRTTPCVAAEFNHPSGELAVILLADLPFAGHSGAALTMMATLDVQQALAAGALSDTLFENYREVANILTALYRPYECRLVLGEVVTDLPSLPTPKKLLIRNPPRRVDWDLTIDSYGDGRIALLTVA